MSSTQQQIAVIREARVTTWRQGLNTIRDNGPNLELSQPRGGDFNPYRTRSRESREQKMDLRFREVHRASHSSAEELQRSNSSRPAGEK